MGDRVVYGPVGDATAKEVAHLLAQASWAWGRNLAGIEAMLAATTYGVVARDGDVLVGFARALTDGLYRALIDDVVVDEAWRGRGVGQGLIRRLLAELRGVEQVRLACGPELIPFYEALGFKLDPGTKMILASDTTSGP